MVFSLRGGGRGARNAGRKDERARFSETRRNLEFCPGVNGPLVYGGDPLKVAPGEKNSSEEMEGEKEKGLSKLTSTLPTKLNGGKDEGYSLFGQIKAKSLRLDGDPGSQGESWGRIKNTIKRGGTQQHKR